jgi:hypothetical protein
VRNGSSMSATLRRALSVAPLVVIIGVGIALRVRLLASPIGRLDADESVVALMGVREHHGSHPLFFWGQYYGGTFEVALVSLVQLIRRGVIAVKVVPLALSGAAGVLTWRAARRLVDETRALLAGALVVGWPGTVWLATKERGFYWMTLVLVVGALVTALRIRDEPAHRARDAMLLGGLCGLAWYETAQSAFVLVPLVVWLGCAIRPSRALATRFAAGVFVGAALWLWGIVRHGTLVFRQPGPSSSYFGRLRGLVGTTVPRALGLRGTYYGGYLLGAIGVLVAIVAAVALAVALVRVLRAGPQHRWAPLAWVTVAFPFLAAFPKATAVTFEPRYALLIVPFAAIALAALARRTSAMIAVTVVVLAFGGANTRYVLHFSDRHPTALDLTPADLRPLRGVLTLIHAPFLYADYWLAYPLTEATHEGIVASPLDDPRSAYHQAIVQASHTRVWALFGDSPRDRALPSVLEARHIEYERIATQHLALYILKTAQDPTTLAAFWSQVPAGYG